MNNKGFTILELLVVIFIISVISAIVLVALGESRERSRNTARAVQIIELQKAFDIVFSDTGYYPRHGTGASATVCLGDYPDNACWQNGNSVQETTAIETAIVPHYMGTIPTIDNTNVFGEGSGSTYEGMIYTHLNYGKNYEIRYFMEGNGRPCEISDATGQNVGEDTMCIISR